MALFVGATWPAAPVALLAYVAVRGVAQIRLVWDRAGVLSQEDARGRNSPAPREIDFKAEALNCAKSADALAWMAAAIAFILAY